MKKRKIIVIIFFIALLTLQTVYPKSNRKIQQDLIELKYDKSDKGSGLALNKNGHLVYFFPIDKKITLKKIKIYCSTKHSDHDFNPELYILNNNYKSIYKKTIDFSIFKNSPRWTEIDIDNVTVEKGFYILFITNSGRDSGIYVFYTENINENHSNQGTLKNKNTWNLQKYDINKINWKIRVYGSYAEENIKITEPIIKENYNSIDDLVKDLNTPEKLAEWMGMILSYKSKYGIKAENQTPEETLKIKTGNCHDLSIFSFYVLNQNNYNPLFFNIQFKDDSVRNHIITIYKNNNKFFSIDNTALRGPYKNYEEIAEVYGEDWWRYIIYNSIEDTITYKNAVKTIYRLNE